MSLEYSSSPLPPSSTGHVGYFGENGVYYDVQGLEDEKKNVFNSSHSKGGPLEVNPSLRLLWLLVSSMVAVQKGDCQLCPTHNGMYPNVANCKCYYKCIDGVPVQKSCPPGKKFDVMSMSCTFPGNTICAGTLLQMLPSVMNKNPEGQGMMQMLQQMQQQQMMQQMQQQMMQQQQMQQQQQMPQMQQMPQVQMGGNGGKFHITVAIAKPKLQGGGGGNGNGGGGNGNGGGGNGNGGGGNQMQVSGIMQVIQMLIQMVSQKGMMDQGTMNQNMMNQNMMGQGMMNQGMMNQNMMGQGMMNQNMMNQNMMGQGMMNQGMMNQGMMNQGMMNQGMMNQGMMNQNMMGQNMGQQNMGQQNMGQQNMGQQNMNQNMMQQGGGGGGGGGNQPQCANCNRPKINIDYSFHIKKMFPFKLKMAYKVLKQVVPIIPLATLLSTSSPIQQATRNAMLSTASPIQQATRNAMSILNPNVRFVL